jgi:hypothetical protein
MFERSNDITRIFTLLIIGCVIIFGCVRRLSHYPDTMPNDFNFISNIADGEYILDTYKSKLTKTIDWDTDTTISYKIPFAEKQKIYKILKKIDIFQYPENYAPTSKKDVFPSFTYRFEFTMNDIDYKINWQENTESEIKDARELRKLFIEIQKYLENDYIIKELPESKRAFF